MNVQHIPLLKIQRDLHDIPRGMERFNAYLQTMFNDAGDDVELLPLVAMNPMGREHVAEQLNVWLALEAETIAEEAITDAKQRLPILIQQDYKHGFVIMDDIHGGWTNRAFLDYKLRFDIQVPSKRAWITTPLWVSDVPSKALVRQCVWMSLYRIAHIQAHGTPRTLSQMMTQEGMAGVFAGVLPTLDKEEIDYSREVIAPYGESEHIGECIAALYGDSAARSLGYAPMGLSAQAGFNVALADALAMQ